MTNRLSRLRAELDAKELDAMLVSSSENRRYMSGFDGSAGYLLITQSDAVLATDFRYTEQAETQAPDFRIHRIRGPLNWFPELAAELGASRIGFESEEVTVQMHTALLKAIDESEAAHKPEMVPATEVVGPPEGAQGRARSWRYSPGRWRSPTRQWTMWRRALSPA